MCSLLADPAAFSVVVQLPLSPRPWGLKFHGYRAQNVLMPERQRSWVIGSAPLVAPPLLPGHRFPPQPYVSSVGPSAPPAGPPAGPVHVPLFPAQIGNPETGTPPPLGHHDWSGPEPQKSLIPDLPKRDLGRMPPGGHGPGENF
jgi:hypothetical protein